MGVFVCIQLLLISRCTGIGARRSDTMNAEGSDFSTRRPIRAHNKAWILQFLSLSLSLCLVQLRLQLWEAFCQVRSLCSHLRGNDVTDSALSTDSSMDESSETSSAKDVPTGSLDTALHELKRLTQNLLDGNESTVRDEGVY